MYDPPDGGFHTDPATRESEALGPLPGTTRREFLNETGVLLASVLAVMQAACRTGPCCEPSSTTPGSPTVSMFLTRFSYTPETWARMAKHPEDRRNAAKAYIESVGGKLHGFWYALGEVDGYTLWEAPNSVAMAAVSIALSAGGALSKCETTPLLTVEETLEALGRVESVRYRQPGK